MPGAVKCFEFGATHESRDAQIMRFKGLSRVPSAPVLRHEADGTRIRPPVQPCGNHPGSHQVKPITRPGSTAGL